MIGKRLLLRELPKLEREGVIHTETAERIKAFYGTTKAQRTSLLLITFGIIGSILIGSGIILLLAHNWDDLPRWVRTIISIVPLIAAQTLSGYTLLKKRDSVAWKESSTILLFFAVGTSISLISQTYNIYGDFGRFLLVWSLLVLPALYLFNAVSLGALYLLWIALWTGYQTGESVYPWLYWPLTGAAVPFAYRLLKDYPDSIRFSLFSWAGTIFITATIPGLFSVMKSNFFVLFVPFAFAMLFLLLYLIGNLKFYDATHLFANPGLLLGSIGIPVLLLIFTFEDVWKFFKEKHWKLIASPEDILSIAILIVMAIAIILLLLHHFKSGRKDILYFGISFFAFVSGYAIIFSNIPIIFNQIIFNFTLFLIGVSTIIRGAKQANLPTINFGMIIISALILCRFLDSDLSFVIRGIAFIAIGAGFLSANYFIMRKDKNEK